MRTTPFKWLFARLHLALFTALATLGLALLLVCPANAAPLEEDIPLAPVPRHAKARPSPLAETPSGSSTSPEEFPSPPERSGTDQSDAAPTTAANGHKYFPYTIRSGDTLQKIADIFGVQVADITRANRHIADYDLIAGDTIRIPNPF